MRRSAVTESKQKPENEDSATLKEDEENKDSILEHEYWQDESTKL